MAHIVRFQGGLGNQLFEYGLYRKFVFLGYDTYADLWKYKGKGRGRDNRPFELNKLGIKVREASKKDIKRFFCNEDIDAVRLWNYKFGTGWVKFFGKNKYFEEKYATADLGILDKTEGYFSGYWQSEDYFSDIKDIIMKEITFPSLSESGNAAANMISGSEDSVSIHVRLTDYIEQSDRYGGICTKEYYEKAMDHIKRVLGREPEYYVFSDDIQLSKKVIGDGKNVHFVDVNDGQRALDDLQLMGLCRHHIIANSSFSWWGAWLGKYRDGMVIAPKKWFADTQAEGIVPKRWIRI